MSKITPLRQVTENQTAMLATPFSTSDTSCRCLSPSRPVLQLLTASLTPPVPLHRVPETYILLVALILAPRVADDWASEGGNGEDSEPLKRTMLSGTIGSEAIVDLLSSSYWGDSSRNLATARANAMFLRTISGLVSFGFADYNRDPPI